MGLYAIPGVVTVVLVARYRQPLLVTGNIFLLVFVASLGDELAWAELVAASLLAGLVVLALGPTGVVARLARWLPVPIVQGLLAGVVVGFVIDMFSALDEEPALVGATLVTYLVARRVLEPRVPALLPALLVGVATAVVLGDAGSLPDEIVWSPAFTTPELSWRGVLTVTPVMVVLMTVQSNVPSSVLLRREGYEPPDAIVSAVSGAGTAAGSVLGPIGLSLSLPLTGLCAGPDAGAHDLRHVSAYVAGAALLVLGVLAGAATATATVVPAALLTAFVGLALLNVLVSALRQATEGPLVLGPVLAFVIAQSNVELLELGPFFWAPIGGVVASTVLEPVYLRLLRETTPQSVP